MQADAFAPEQLPVRPERMRQHRPQDEPRPRRLRWQLIEQFEAKCHLPGRLERYERLRHRLAHHVPRGPRVTVEVEIDDGRGVAVAVRRAAGDHDLADELRDRRVAREHAGEIREWPEGHERHLPRIGMKRLPDHLFRDMPAVEPRYGQIDAPQAVGPVHVEGLGRPDGVGGGGAEPGQSWRVEEPHERLEVGRRLLRGDIPAAGRHGHDLEPGVEEGDGERHGVVDAGIDVENHLAGHVDFPGDVR